MWQHNYTPVADSLALSALCAALPVFVLLLLIGVLRKPAWIAALFGLGAAVVVALAEYGMPVGHLASSVGYGAATGIFPSAGSCSPRSCSTTSPSIWGNSKS